MGICFIGKRHFHDFIEEYIEPRPGNFVNLETGEVIGKHKGKCGYNLFLCVDLT